MTASSSSPKDASPPERSPDELLALTGESSSGRRLRRCCPARRRLPNEILRALVVVAKSSPMRCAIAGPFTLSVIGSLVGPALIAFMLNRIADQQRGALEIRVPVVGREHAPVAGQLARTAIGCRNHRRSRRRGSRRPKSQTRVRPGHTQGISRQIPRLPARPDSGGLRFHASDLARQGAAPAIPVWRDSAPRPAACASSRGASAPHRQRDSILRTWRCRAPNSAQRWYST